MLFDVTITLVLFSVVSRFTARRRDDVLYYVSNTDTPRRNSAGRSARGIVRSGKPARKPVSFTGAP